VTDLDKLIAVVEAGECPDFCPMWHGEGLCVEVEAAFAGSLDAALRLHGALLPGWDWSLFGMGQAVVSPPGNPRTTYYGGAVTPARAWLLAILRALKQGETE
jgi:hypothetical protein